MHTGQVGTNLLDLERQAVELEIESRDAAEIEGLVEHLEALELVDHLLHRLANRIALGRIEGTQDTERVLVGDRFEQRGRGSFGGLGPVRADRGQREGRAADEHEPTEAQQREPTGTTMGPPLGHARAGQVDDLDRRCVERARRRAGRNRRRATSVGIALLGHAHVSSRSTRVVRTRSDAAAATTPAAPATTAGVRTLSGDNTTRTTEVEVVTPTNRQRPAESRRRCRVWATRAAPASAGTKKNSSPSRSIESGSTPARPAASNNS